MIANQEKSIGPRGNVMTAMHWGVFWAVSFGFLVIVVVSSLKQVEMHVTTPGENYQCTDAVLEHKDGQQIGSISHDVSEGEYEFWENTKESIK